MVYDSNYLDCILFVDPFYEYMFHTSPFAQRTNLGNAVMGNNNTNGSNDQLNYLRRRTTYADGSYPYPVQYSKFRGVFGYRGLFEACVEDNCDSVSARKEKTVYLGGFDNETDAATAHDLAALKIWGESAPLNYPVKDYEEDLEKMKDMSKDDLLKSIRRQRSGFGKRASQYRGVSAIKHAGGNPFKTKWVAKLGRSSHFKELHLGTFETEEAAAKAYDIAVIKIRGIWARTNFCIRHYNVPKIRECPSLPTGTLGFTYYADKVLQRMCAESRSNRSGFLM